MKLWLETMRVMSSPPPMCSKEHCWEWGRKHMRYCLCDARDGVSLALGLVSVISWGVAEIPQILTNYREKSAEGLSLAFLCTWIVGDLFNLFGCLLEPATLPTQFYMAILFTVTTLFLTGQSIYYGHIYPRWKFRRHTRKEQTAAAENERIFSSSMKNQDKSPESCLNRTSAYGTGVAASSPIPLPALRRYNSLERELYYTSARSLSRSHTPTIGAFLAQRRTSSMYNSSSVEDPLLRDALLQSTPPSNVKTMLCTFSALTFFLGNLNLPPSNGELGKIYGKPNLGVVMQVGRRLLQAGSSSMQETGGTGSSGVGTYLGWGMAVIYMGGRLPQICLNIRRGHVEGLNPLMFVFALIGNITYVGSILVDSLDWSKIGSNLPWLVDAGGCVVLDTFILLQFAYFRCRARQDPEDKQHQNFN